MNDLIIIFKKGDAIAFAQYGTTAGRYFLGDCAGGRMVNHSWIIKAEDLLRFIEKGMERNLRIHWRQQ